MYAGGSFYWFQKHYPNFTQGFHSFYVFELLDLGAQYPNHQQMPNFHYIRKAAWTHSNGVLIKGLKMARVMEGQSMVHLQSGQDKRMEWRSPSVDMDTFIRNVSSVQDFVVVKIDIEGGEWDLLSHMFRMGTFAYIDELFLECHSLVSVTTIHSPMGQDCIDLINSLRKMGVYTHNWF